MACWGWVKMGVPILALSYLSFDLMLFPKVDVLVYVMLAFSVLWYLLPIDMIFSPADSSGKEAKEKGSVVYDDVRLSFFNEYDRANPLTHLDGMENFFNWLDGKRATAKIKAKELKEQIEKDQKQGKKIAEEQIRLLKELEGMSNIPTQQEPAQEQGQGGNDWAFMDNMYEGGQIDMNSYTQNAAYTYGMTNETGTMGYDYGDNQGFNAGGYDNYANYGLMDVYADPYGYNAYDPYSGFGQNQAYEIYVDPMGNYIDPMQGGYVDPMMNQYFDPGYGFVDQPIIAPINNTPYVDPNYQYVNVNDPIIQPMQNAVVLNQIHPAPVYDPYGNSQMMVDSNPVPQMVDQFGNQIQVQTVDQFGNPIQTGMVDQFGNPVQAPMVDQWGNPLQAPMVDQWGQQIQQPAPYVDPYTQNQGYNNSGW